MFVSDNLDLRAPQQLDLIQARQDNMHKVENFIHLENIITDMRTKN